jgi:putative ubiquitin-RnfH superfamily antitoxin RatB of RatAB toxin-antitoxin module
MPLKMKKYQLITRQEFLKFFRDDEKLNELTADDRVEIFRTILIGGSDLTKDLLNEILSEYTDKSIISKIQ